MDHEYKGGLMEEGNYGWIQGNKCIDEQMIDE